MKRRLYQVDAFTRKPFEGNPAGVVIPADDLTDAQMQSIARELGNPESAFVFKPEGVDHDLKVRFFTPTTEIPMCGHNTVALHVVRAIKNGVRGAQVQSTKAGNIPVEIEESARGIRVSMTQTVRSFEPVSNYLLSELSASLGYRESERDLQMPVQIVSTGNRKLIVGLRTEASVHALRPDLNALKEIGEKLEVTGFYVFSLGRQTGSVVTEGRMFAPQLGIPEDPVTGMAIGPLGAYLVQNHLVDPEGDCFRFRACQGKAMERPGEADVEVRMENGVPKTVKVSGEAVIVFETTIDV